MAVSSGSLIGASVFLLPVMPWSLSEHVPSLKAWACALALGVVCTGVAYILYFRMIEFYGASRSMVVAYLIPIFGVLWGYLFLEESINVSMLIGGSIVLAGTILVSRSGAKHQAKDN